MKTKAFFLLCFAIALVPRILFASVWETCHQGSFSSGVNWVGGVAPPHVSSDTFLIHHPLILENPIHLQGSGRIEIDSAAGICGHTSLTTSSLTHVIVRGVLDLDSLFLSGELWIPYYGVLELTISAHVLGGGHLIVDGELAVGWWFECRQPTYSFLTEKEIANAPSTIWVSPNPSSGRIILGGMKEGTQVNIFDVLGKKVNPHWLGPNDEVFDLTHLSDGIYFLEFEPWNPPVRLLLQK